MPSANTAFSSLSRWLPVRPALPAVMLFALGISLHPYLTRFAGLWLCAFALLTTAAFISARYPRCLVVCVAGAIVSGGVAAGQIAAYQYQPTQIALFATEEPRLASFELQFDQTPQLSAPSPGRHLPGKQSGNASIVGVKTWKGWEKASGDVLFSVAQVEPRILAGQRVRVVGMLQRPAPAMNPGEFDWAVYCRQQGVLASIRVNRACDLEVMNAGVMPTLAEARLGVRDWLALGFSREHQVDRALLQALMLGDRGPELHAVERDFQKTGTSHLLSSSGLRMSILAALIYGVCRFVRVRPRVVVMAIALGIVGWGAVTLYTPQALRPVIIAVVIGIGLIRRRTSDSVQHLAIAALGILIVEPLDFYSAGFQFSFIIVLGMLLLTRGYTGQLQSVRDPDQAALERFGKLSGWQQFRWKCLHYLMQFFVASMVAWVVSIPLVAYHFEQFTPWAVPLGIVLSPVVFVAMAGGFLKIVASMLIPSMASTWATIAASPVALLRHAIALAAHLPLADVPVGRPPVWAILLFYALLCLPLLPATGRRIRVSLQCGPVAACVVLLFIPWLLGFVRQSASPDMVRVTLLSIGAGQCAVVEPPGGPALMVDAGSTTLSDPLHLCVGPFLHHEGKTSMEAIYLSHGDYDHISATEGAVEEYGVERVITTPFFRKHANESRPCEHLVEFLDETHHTPREVVAGETFSWGVGLTAEVLWPTKQCDMNSNNAGMVLHLTYGNRSILFPADIQDPAMRELLKHPEKLKSDVLVAAHHGSSEQLTAAFVRAVNPEVIVSSNADHLTKKQRDFEQMIDHRPLFRTNRCGAITIEIDRNGRLTVTPFLTRKQQGIVVERDGTVHSAK